MNTSLTPRRFVWVLAAAIVFLLSAVASQRLPEPWAWIPAFLGCSCGVTLLAAFFRHRVAHHICLGLLSLFFALFAGEAFLLSTLSSSPLGEQYAVQPPWTLEEGEAPLAPPLAGNGQETTVLLMRDAAVQGRDEATRDALPAQLEAFLGKGYRIRTLSLPLCGGSAMETEAAIADAAGGQKSLAVYLPAPGRELLAYRHCRQESGVAGDAATGRQSSPRKLHHLLEPFLGGSLIFQRLGMPDADAMRVLRDRRAEFLAATNKNLREKGFPGLLVIIPPGDAPLPALAGQGVALFDAAPFFPREKTRTRKDGLAPGTAAGAEACLRALAEHIRAATGEAP